MTTPIRCKRRLDAAVTSSLLVALLALAGCNRNDVPAPASAPPAAAEAPAYTPPTAEQLAQMVAPIALFPDRLVAQVLAGATYPDQIAAANQWLAQNPSLKGDSLQHAANQQPWDVSVRSLTAFPAVLNQMAANPQWTTALGQTYVNNPGDVMNAIQALRLRAQQSGNLKSSRQLKVTAVTQAAPPPQYSGYDQIVPPPPQLIEIEPAQADVVYVPTYDPTAVYGGQLRSYPGYDYRPPVYRGSDLATVGLLTFGAGILVGAAIDHGHRDGPGWHSWGLNWGGAGRGGGPDRRPAPNDRNGAWQRPAVVYNNATYVSHSTTLINRNDNRNDSRIDQRVDNRIDQRAESHDDRRQQDRGLARGGERSRETSAGNATAGGSRPAVANGAPNFNASSPGVNLHAPSGAMSIPHFGANDVRPGARPTQAAHAFATASAPAPQAQANERAAAAPPAQATRPADVSQPPHHGAAENRGPQEAEHASRAGDMRARHDAEAPAAAPVRPAPEQQQAAQQQQQAARQQQDARQQQQAAREQQQAAHQQQQQQRQQQQQAERQQQQSAHQQQAAQQQQQAQQHQAEQHAAPPAQQQAAPARPPQAAHDAPHAQPSHAQEHPPQHGNDQHHEGKREEKKD